MRASPIPSSRQDAKAPSRKGQVLETLTHASDGCRLEFNGSSAQEGLLSTQLVTFLSCTLRRRVF